MNTKITKLLFTAGLCVLFLTLLTSFASAQFEMNTYRGGLDDRSSTFNGAIAPIGSLVEIYDQAGRKLETLLDQQLLQGNHRIDWDPDQVGRGSYFCHFTVGNQSYSKKIIKTKFP